MRSVTLLVCIYLAVVHATFDTRGTSYEETDCTLRQWDYIVVGGGSSGCVVAARLSENGANSVLLIEAGGPSQRSVGGFDYVAAQYSKTATGATVFQEPLTRYDVPAFATSAYPSIATNPTWGFNITTPAGYEVPHSRILGGNGVHNNMIWTRMTAGTLNAWNLTGWRYDDVLPFFKKSENASASRVAANAAYHGFTGPVQISDNKGPDKSGPIFVQACVNAGYPNNTDFNGATREGCGYHVFNIDNQGVRASSAHAYLAPALGRRNLRVVLHALVTKVKFNSTKHAVGVKFVKNGITYTVRAKKEIILSLGAINTPKLLMLSGVGPASLLQSFNITVLSDLPVGRRQKTHASANVVYEYPNETYANVYDISNTASQYARLGTGPLASAGFFGFGFVKTKPSLIEPNLLVGIYYASTPRQMTVQISLHQPEGDELGFTNITSADPFAPPFVYLNVYQNEANVIAVAEGINISRTIMNTPPATTIFGAELVPGSSYQTAEQLRAYVRTQNGGSKTHIWGGACLGNDGDPNAVLDPRARVRGVHGLRVSDLSIVPRVLGGHPMANVIMFGERISSFILEDNA